MEKKMNRKRQLNETEQLKPLRKALLVTHVSGFVPQFEMNNVRILQELGYEVHYASNFHTPSYGTDNHRLDGTGIIRHQIDFVRSPFSAKNCLVYRQMCDLMKREHFSLVHCHTPMGGVMARLAAHVTGTGPVIYTAHGFHFLRGPHGRTGLFTTRWRSSFPDIRISSFVLIRRIMSWRSGNSMRGMWIMCREWG